MATALGKHPQLIAWQIDNGIGGHFTECSFNDQTRRDWHSWLKAKYEKTSNGSTTRWDCGIGRRRYQLGTGAHAAARAAFTPGAGDGLDALQQRHDLASSKCRWILLHELTPNARSPPI